MKMKLSAILMASALTLSTLLVSCQDKQGTSDANETTVETNAQGEETIIIGALEKGENGLQYRLYTEKSGEKYYAIVGLGEYKETTLTVPDTFRDMPVKLIADSAFKNADKITEVTISDGVNVIGKQAFSDCNALATVNIGNGVDVIGDKAFYTCDQLVTVNFGTAVNAIEYEAFYGCTSLKELTLPQGLSTIGEHAFYNCYKLENIQIFDELTFIGRDAFYGCGSLKSTETDGAYYLGNSDNPKLLLRSIKDKTVTEFTVPENTKYIGQTAFANSETLTTVTLPAGLTVIAEGAMQHCDKLVSIQFQGSCNEWNQVSKGYLWNYETGNYTVTCSDGTVPKA